MLLDSYTLRQPLLVQCASNIPSQTLPRTRRLFSGFKVELSCTQDELGSKMTSSTPPFPMAIESSILKLLIYLWVLSKIYSQEDWGCSDRILKGWDPTRTSSKHRKTGCCTNAEPTLKIELSLRQRIACKHWSCQGLFQDKSIHIRIWLLRIGTWAKTVIWWFRFGCLTPYAFTSPGVGA